jgi:hypothetical protein
MTMLHVLTYTPGFNQTDELILHNIILAITYGLLLSL